MFHTLRPEAGFFVCSVNRNVINAALIEVEKMGPADWVRALGEHGSILFRTLQREGMGEQHYSTTLSRASV